MPSQTEELVLAIVLAATAGPTATPELCEAIQTYVRGLKASGYRPEEVLAAIRALIAEAGVEKRSASIDSPHAQLADRVVAWSIEAYFPAADDTG
jgi:alkylhydroperoxidase/carboxymuconolactone decarboxylase family protein YurZ